MTIVEDLVSLSVSIRRTPGRLRAAALNGSSQRLDRAGIDVVRVETPEGRPNVVATVPGSGNAPRLVLLGHMDTVPWVSRGPSIPLVEWCVTARCGAEAPPT